jgi:hypothetical protein
MVNNENNILNIKKSKNNTNSRKAFKHLGLMIMGGMTTVGGVYLEKFTNSPNYISNLMVYGGAVFGGYHAGKAEFYAED